MPFTSTENDFPIWTFEDNNFGLYTKVNRKFYAQLCIIKFSDNGTKKSVYNYRANFWYRL